MSEHRYDAVAAHRCRQWRGAWIRQSITSGLALPSAALCSGRREPLSRVVGRLALSGYLRRRSSRRTGGNLGRCSGCLTCFHNVRVWFWILLRAGKNRIRAPTFESRVFPTKSLAELRSQERALQLELAVLILIKCASPLSSSIFDFLPKPCLQPATRGTLR